MTKRGPGRPPTPERDQRRGKLGRTIKVSLNEYERIAARARVAGRSVPDHIMWPMSDRDVGAPLEGSVSAWGVTTAATPARLISAPRAGAAEALRDFGKSGRFIGVNKGQFSLIDILQALLDKTGPADVTICAWTSGIRDAEQAAWLLRTGRIRKLRWLVDRSFVTRQPKYAAEIRRLFGEDALLEGNNHAKVLLIGNDDWHVTVRSSMNLNRNSRLEQFDVDDDAAIFEFFNSLIEELCGIQGTGIGHPCEAVDANFEQMSLGYVAPEATAYVPPQAATYVADKY